MLQIVTVIALKESVNKLLSSKKFNNDHRIFKSHIHQMLWAYQPHGSHNGSIINDTIHQRPLILKCYRLEWKYGPKSPRRNHHHKWIIHQLPGELNSNNSWAATSQHIGWNFSVPASYQKLQQHNYFKALRLSVRNQVHVMHCQR